MKRLSFLLVIVFLISCSDNAAPSFKKVTNIVVKEMNIRNVTLESNLVYFNPNRLGGNVKAFDIDVVINDIDVGKLKQKKEIEILAKQDFSIPTVISFPPKKIMTSKGLMKSALQLFANEKANVKYSGTMTVTVAGLDFEIPLDYEEEIPLKNKR